MAIKKALEFLRLLLECLGAVRERAEMKRQISVDHFVSFPHTIIFS
jgi:hypothetical protein